MQSRQSHSCCKCRRGFLLSLLHSSRCNFSLNSDSTLLLYERDVCSSVCAFPSTKHGSQFSIGIFKSTDRDAIRFDRKCQMRSIQLRPEIRMKRVPADAGYLFPRYVYFHFFSFPFVSTFFSRELSRAASSPCAVTGAVITHRRFDRLINSLQPYTMAYYYFSFQIYAHVSTHICLMMYKICRRTFET